jgi:hypothetical protein
MSTSLRTYRICFYDAVTKIVMADWLEAEDDADAVSKADGFGSKCEIWDGSRLVAELEAERRLA